MQKPRPYIETTDFRELSAIAPALAGDYAYQRFCTPYLSERRTPDHKHLTARSRFHLKKFTRCDYPTLDGTLATFSAAPTDGSSRGHVLIIHGWTSESSFMAVLGEQIRRIGFSVTLVDCPAHGLSSGRQTSLIACARAIGQLAHRVGHPDAIVAHSMGCLAALLALEGAAPMLKPLRTLRLVLMSSPNAFQEITQSFGDTLHLGPMAQRQFERQLERIAHRQIKTFSASRLLAKLKVPALLLHATDDQEVLFRCSKEIAESCPNAELKPLEHLGHRKILYAPPAIRAAQAFLKG
jgi:pimeloyl-ACP methyl ester carboxylesterase